MYLNLDFFFFLEKHLGFRDGGADDFVADEEVLYLGVWVKGLDIGSDLKIGQGLVGGDVGDEFVG